MGWELVKSCTLALATLSFHRVSTWFDSERKNMQVDYQLQ